jgi:hypothetical protein
MSAFLPGTGRAQEDSSSAWSVGADGELVSQFVWRGLVLNNHPSLQPEVYLEHGSFDLGVWASFPFDGSYREIDTYLSWSHSFSAGELDLNAQDYYYPQYAGFFDFSQAAGGHTGELSGAFTPSVVPLTFTLAWNAYDDPDHSLFAKVGGEHSFDGIVDLDANIGFLLKNSPYYYGASAGDVMNYTIRATRNFSLARVQPHVSVALTRSPVLGKTLWVFAVGL